MSFEKLFLITILVAFIILSLCEARGGRRGGSFGGLFGSWRKYKKPSSGGGSSRRIVSSSPVHTPITKAWHDNKKANVNDKFQKNFKPNNMPNGYGTPPLPAGGSYYQNNAALPGNAIYIAQAPPRGLGIGNFLTGYLTGRLLTMGFPSAHHQVTHIYRESPTAAEPAVGTNLTSDFISPYNPLENSTIRAFNAPLMEFPGTTESSAQLETGNLTMPVPENTTTPPFPLYGIICIPMLLNETNALGEAVQNEKTICYPAPEPPAPQKNIKPVPLEIAGDITEH